MAAIRSPTVCRRPAAVRRPADPPRQVIEYLTLEYLLALIEDLGVGPIRDVGLLDSAMHRPQANVYGDDGYPDID